MLGTGKVALAALRDLGRALDEPGRRLPIGIWFGLTAFAGVAGPFGTLEAMPLGQRLLYWGVVVAISIKLGSATRSAAQDQPIGYSVLIWSLFVCALAAVFHAANDLLFRHWHGIDRFLYLLWVVGMVTLLIHFSIWLGRKSLFALSADSDAQSPLLLERLPSGLHAPIIRIEARDHHVQVVTEKGAGLILMRLGDALSLLRGIDGLQVHRSHWVALEGVASHEQENGRDWLLCRDGARVPVSRRYRPDAMAAGLL